MDDRTFRNAMGRFATGVTVITTKTNDDDIHGMTANAFMSVSLDPKLVTISIDHRANMLEKINESEQFSVNILTYEQKEVSMHFAGQKEMEEEVKFEFVQGVPIIGGSLASVVCDVHTSYEVGDHTLFIGEVKDIIMNDGEPLTFYSGKYGKNKID